MDLKHRVTGTGIEFSRDKLTWTEWQELGLVVGSTVSAGPWLVADWVNYGEKAYGERYTQALDVTGLSPDRLRTYAWIGNRYSYSRRRSALSFEVHRELAYIHDDVEQDAALDMAEREGMGSREVREWKREERGQTQNNVTPLWLVKFELGEEIDGNEFVELVEACFGRDSGGGCASIKHTRPDGI